MIQPVYLKRLKSSIFLCPTLKKIASSHQKNSQQDSFSPNKSNKLSVASIKAIAPALAVLISQTSYVIKPLQRNIAETVILYMSGFVILHSVVADSIPSFVTLNSNFDYHPNILICSKVLILLDIICEISKRCIRSIFSQD